jgi:beta-glucosidase
MRSSWQPLGPEVLYWAPRHVRSLWNPASIFITENGCATADVVAVDGHVYDTDRVMFLRGCLTELQRATSEGIPVDGYFLWSALDNFEWAEGFGDRFGIVYVDFGTQERIPKLSASWFREAITRNAVV